MYDVDMNSNFAQFMTIERGETNDEIIVTYGSDDEAHFGVHEIPLYASLVDY